MTLGERLKLVRGTTSQRAFAAELGIHENSVQRRATRFGHANICRIGQVRNINLHWLLTGRGAMRVDEDDAGLLAEKSVALADALRLAYGARYASVPLETRARRCAPEQATCVRSGVTEDTLPGTEALAKLLKLTIEVMRKSRWRPPYSLAHQK
jgi:hypothetical protein